MILLDTHALIWLSADPRRLSRKAREAIAEASASRAIWISAITIWEVAMLARRGRIKVSGSVESTVYDLIARVEVKPISPAVAVAAVSFSEETPGDPADRIIAATSFVHAMGLVTADQKLRRLKQLQTIW